MKKKDELLRQILDLRRKKEEVAHETVIRREAALRRAAHQAEKTSEELVRHVERVEAFERTLLASVIGKEMSGTAVERMKADLDLRRYGNESLKRAAVEAHAAAIDQAVALRTAQDNFRNRQRQVAKLDEVVKEHRKKTARRNVIMAEAVDDDQVRPSAVASIFGFFGLGSKDQGSR